MSRKLSISIDDNLLVGSLTLKYDIRTVVKNFKTHTPEEMMAQFGIAIDTMIHHYDLDNKRLGNYVVQNEPTIFYINGDIVTFDRDIAKDENITATMMAGVVKDRLAKMIDVEKEPVADVAEDVDFSDLMLDAKEPLAQDADEFDTPFSASTK